MKRNYISLLLLLIFFQTFANTNSKQEVIIPLTEINLNEITINASKDSRKLKEIPTSVSILPTNAIELNEINTLNNAVGLIPNFVMPDYGSKLTSPIYIRGVGSRVNAPSIGLYVDNVPYFEKASFDFDFFDIQRIEVLRGPQGTLYGRNSMGGLIDITTLSPMTYQGNHANMGVGNFGTYKLNVAHYAKPSNKFAYSLSGNILHQDGFHTNSFNGNKVDSLNSYGLRNKLIFNISDNFSIENIASIENSKQGGYPYAVLGNKINYNQVSGYDRVLISDALKIKYSTKNWDLTNVVSYQNLDDKQKIDQDFSADSLYFVIQNQLQHTVSNEFIIQSKKTGRYQWLMGVFGFIQLADWDVIVDTYKPTKVWTEKKYGSNTSGHAIFHQSTLKIYDHWTLTGGIRYDSERSVLKYNYQGLRNNIPDAKIDTLYPALIDESVLPKIALSYQLNNTNIYASFATGYKPGGYNTTFELPEHLTFKNETSINYELGVKTSMLENYLFADAAVFYSQIRNQQISRTVPSGRGTYLDNSGLSENKGYELSLRNNAIGGFEGMIAYGYTHSKILEYKLNANVNYNNKFTPYIPRHTFALQLAQTIDIANNLLFDKMRISMLFTENGETYWNLTNTQKQDAYGILNGKVSFFKDNIQIDFWAKNITNTQYNAFLFEALGKTFVQAGKPLHAGINVSVKF